MTTETQQALAIAFRHVDGTNPLRDDLVKAMSLQLEWTKPSKADNLVDRGLNAGHLTEDDGQLSLNFDPETVDVPFGFSPSDELFEPVDRPDPEPDEQTPDEPQPQTTAETGSRLESLLETLETTLDWDRNESMATVNAKQEELGNLVTLETAGLLVCAQRGIDVREDARNVLEDLRAA